ncbi:protein kinase [Acaryochloris sp. IP29b_bin.148]|uniref:protein kinase domain-containing protein n=1 Tax=Acaryochloris sp. IP29b_bin.148 TaxID=2969218 RepID=UPI0026112301|nr:protein kinase [Acaryochloris sp. IP29b_bin.148]
MLGKVLASRYRIINAMAQGGFGKTFLAEDVLLPGAPHCVVKQLTVGQENTLGISRRLFNQEAITLQKLGKHPQIPQLYAYFEENNEFFLVQELIEGISLKEEFQQKKQLSELQGIELLRDCLNTLEFVHSLGVIHRDIKPANLMRRQVDGRIVLLDFGAVKEIEIDQSQLAETTVSIGTQGYMPDEQLRGKPQLASDIYALGMTCLQGLTATHPRNFERDGFDEICWQPLVSVHPALDQLLSKMVRRDPRHRYAQVAAILADLDQYFGPSAPTSAAVPAMPSVSPLPVSNAHALPSQHSQTNPDSVPTSISQTPQPINAQHRPAHSLSQTEIEASDAPTVVSVQRNQQLIPETSTSSPAQRGKAVKGEPALNPRTSVQSRSSPVVGSASQVSEPPPAPSPQSELQTVRQRSESKSTGETLSVLHASSSAPTEVRQKGWAFQRPFSSLKWVATGLLLLLAGLGASAFWLWRPSATSKVLTQLESLLTQKKFADCIRLGETAVSDPDIPESSIREPLAQCYLGAAQAQADQGNYAEALKNVVKVPSHSAHHDQAQQKINAWSTQLLNQAKKIYAEKGQLQEALRLMSSIPRSSAVSEEATKLAKQWQETQKANEKLVKEAQVALDEGRSATAIAKAEQVKQPQFWKQKADKIIQAAEEDIKRNESPPPIVTSPPVPQVSQDPPVYTPRPSPQPSSRGSQNPPPVYNPPVSNSPPSPAKPSKRVKQVCPGPLCVE